MKKVAQLKLDTFFGVKNARKQFFFIDWTEEYPIAKWLSSKPKDSTFSAIMNWYHVGDIIICCKDFPDTEDDNKFYTLVNTPLFDENRRLMSFLKSHLQKCIRRLRKDELLRTVRELLIIDKESIFRRLTIIMFEDSYIKDYYINIVWLLVASSKHYKLRKHHLKLIFEYSLDTSLDTRTEEIPSKSKELFVNYKFLDQIDKSKMLDKNKDFLYSLCLRVGFGCNEFDKSLLENNCHKYYKLMEEGHVLEKYNENIIKDLNTDEIIMNYKFNDVNDFLLQGIDFHCCPAIMWELNKEYSMYCSEERIKNCIWEFSSGVNLRRTSEEEKDVPPDLKELYEVWKLIRNSYRSLEYKYLNEMLGKIKLVELNIH